MIKLIISDIDGTILNENHEYSSYLLDTINAVRARGVLFTLATGRMFDSARKIAEGLGVKLPIICYNGSYIRNMSDNTIHLNEGIAPQDAVKILKSCQEYGYHAQYYMNDKLYCYADTEDMKEYGRITNVPYHPLGEAIYNISYPVHKILLVNKDPQSKEQMQQRLQALGADVDFTSSHKFYLEIMPRGHNKATAVQVLSKILKVDIADIMTAGDSFNDREMLQLVGTGVAMGQAPNAVKTVAKYVTDTNEKDGLAKALERLVLQA